VRIKNSGAYNSDIALVENISDNKVWVRLIPRIDLTASTKKKSFMRIPQKLNFYPTAQMGAYRMTS
jgi:hypothetical protein